jgi:hypothetical protein
VPYDKEEIRMLDPDLSFHWVRRRYGYLSLEDLDLMGDGTTRALVGLDGAIPWLCLPRFGHPRRRTETFAEVELKPLTEYPAGSAGPALRSS